LTVPTVTTSAALRISALMGFLAVGGLSFLIGWLWLIIAPERKDKPQ